MKKKSIKINAILNIIKSLLSVLFPLITYPYATRILGAENLGKVNYGFSIVSYFSLIGVFGITSYAIREGSKIKDDKSKFNVLANELFTINLCTTLLAYILLIATTFGLDKLEGYRILIFIQSLSIIFTTLSIDWVNTIYEDFLFTTVRGIFTHVVSLILLFILVQGRDDYYQYALLTVITNAIICFVNFVYCRRYAKLRITTHPHIKKHIKSMAIFFINAIAVSIYVSADTTMLGWMIGDCSVGVYSVSVKIYSIMKLLLVAIYFVALPRLSYYFGKNDFDNYRKLFSEIVSTLLLLLLPMAAGIYILAPQIMLLIGGQEFVVGATSLSILGIALIFAILGGILTQCLNVSIGKEKITASATIISAIANVLLNIPFILYLQEKGAAITTAISEAIVFFFCAFFVRKQLKEYLDKSVIKNIVHSLIGIICVIGSCLITKQFCTGLWTILLFSMLFSVLSYASALIALKNDAIYKLILSILHKIRKES